MDESAADSTMSSSPSAPLRLSLLSDLTPRGVSPERVWLTAPHPSLPLVATCSADRAVRIYSLTNFGLLSTISGGHKRSVRTCAWKPCVKGESVLATGSFDATVGIWRRWDHYGRRDEGKRSSAVQDGRAEAETENGVEREDGGNGEGEYDNDNDDDDDDDDDDEWRFAVLLDGHDSEVKSVSWSASGSLLATCSRDKSIWIWEDLEDGDNNFETVAVMQEHDGDVKCVAWHPAEDCLASASYDDTIRLWREDLDDWGQVACLRGHTATVWAVAWEGPDNCPRAKKEEEDDGHKEKKEIVAAVMADGSAAASAETSNQHGWKQQHLLSGPRLVSCSDDRTLRVWRRQPKSKAVSAEASSFSTTTGAIPSIIRPAGTDEVWTEEAILPRVHELSVYTVAWSQRTGLVASAGADGKVAIYEERWRSAPAPADDSVADSPRQHQQTEWHVVATLTAAHDIFEINHVAWAKRADRARRGDDDEEVLVTAADDGSVKVWALSDLNPGV